MSSKSEQILQPPLGVRGMKLLDKDAFSKVISVPFFIISANINDCFRTLKPYMLKLDSFKPVKENADGKKEALLNPALITSFEDFKKEDQLKLVELGYTEFDLKWTDVNIKYENWKADVLFRAILPGELANISSFSIVGHIIHLNLKDEHHIFKNIIGSILLDKTPNIRTVVNKLNTIDNTYRNFSMEVLAGDKDTLVSVKENGCMFEFDFADVYWNPRLSTEHGRVVSIFKAGDILFDVFAGVGPFSVPAGKKGCSVYANDLNPESCRWLTHNAKKNHVTDRIQIHTLDGRDFIVTVLRTKLLEVWRSENLKKNVHIVMNLPATAIEFLGTFSKLFNPEEIVLPKECVLLPSVHCYCFIKNAENCRSVVQQLLEDHLGGSICVTSLEVTFVRNVAPNKDMFRASFQLPMEVLFGLQRDEPQEKKIKLT